MTRMSTNQAAYVSFVRANPGCSVADVDRACRRNPRAGHRWVYDGVQRLVRRGILRTSFDGGRHHLYVCG